MADRRTAAMTRLATRLGEHAGRVVSYARAAADVELTGTLTSPSSTGEAARLGTAAGLDLSALDLIIAAEDLVLGGGATLPLVGDEVTTSIGGVEHRFSVSRDAGDDCYRFVDPDRTLIRVHLQHIEEIG